MVRKSEDKSFGSLFSVLTGDEVTLPFEYYFAVTLNRDYIFQLPIKYKDSLNCGANKYCFSTKAFLVNNNSKVSTTTASDC